MIKLLKFNSLKNFCYILLFSLVRSQSLNLTVSYYENLIRENEALAQTYPLPENAYEYKPTNENLTEIGAFDYIIVGAGSAGAVIATRLSERESFSVLLVEAGRDENDFSDIPGEGPYLQGLRFNWNFISVPQNTCCLGMVNDQCPIPRGKTLGGTSVINSLMYVRGNKHDYDSWARDGNVGWSYADVLPYFIKSENSQINGDPGYHGKGGPLNVEYYKPLSPIYYAFENANKELGRKVVDYNGRRQLGVATPQRNTIEGRRDSTRQAFLSLAIRRRNLEVLTNSYVTKILINGNNRNKKAYGIQFSRNNQTYIARAAREVIVSAGSISSPQLLMLSGIGPQQDLGKLNIPLVKDLSVGNNLQDHATYYGLFFTSNYTEPTKTLAENVEEYLHGYGPLTNAENIHGLAFVQSKLMKIPGVPDLELILVPPVAINNFIQKAFHYTNETYNSIYPKLNPQNTIRIYLVLLHPQSTGNVTLRSANPYDYPLINPHFLSDAKNEDIERIYQGIQMTLEIINTTAFRKYNTQLTDIRLPACASHEYLSKDFWYCHIRQLTSHLYHPMGTCKMGPDPAKGAVVDPCLKVHGVEGLRVADASIIPSAISGHTSSPSIMVGERLADMLKGKLGTRCAK